MDKRTYILYRGPVEQVAGFDWDEGNLEKCRKHGVSSEQIDEVLRGTPYVFPDVRHSKSETRYLGIGRDAEGRYILVAFTLRTPAGERLIRPISARFMHAKEITYYERQIKSP